MTIELKTWNLVGLCELFIYMHAQSISQNSITNSSFIVGITEFEYYYLWFVSISEVSGCRTPHCFVLEHNIKWRNINMRFSNFASIFIHLLLVSNDEWCDAAGVHTYHWWCCCCFFFVSSPLPQPTFFSPIQICTENAYSYKLFSVRF